MGRMTDWKRKKLWLEEEPGQVYTRLRVKVLHGKLFKTTAGRKKTETMGYITL